MSPCSYKKRNVRRVHIAFPVLKRCASVIHMSVRQHKRNGRIGTFAYKRFQTAYACKTIDKQRFFHCLRSNSKSSPPRPPICVTLSKNLSACKKLGQNKRLLRKFAALPPFIKRLPSAPLSCIFRFYYTISLKKMSIRKSRLTGLFTLHLKQIFIIRKYFTALLTVNRAFYLPFYEKRQKSSCISGAMWYDYVCVIGVQGESMPTNTVQAVSPYYNPTIEEVSTVPNIKSARSALRSLPQRPCRTR